MLNLCVEVSEFVKVLVYIIGIVGELKIRGKSRNKVSVELVFLNVIGRLGNSQLGVGFMNGLCPSQEWTKTLHADLCGNEIILPVMWRNFFLNSNRNCPKVRVVS